MAELSPRSSFMYSLAWFDTFALSLSPEALERELGAICALAPSTEYPRVLDIGCGVGRTAAGLVKMGYRVTGIDISEEALAVARSRVPDAEFLQHDARIADRLGRVFDLALLLWHSFGLRSRADDSETLHAIGRTLRPAGIFLLDLFHPAWLAANEHRGHRDPRGATIDRHLRAGRCIHRISYAQGGEDRIEFNVYTPAEMTEQLVHAGFEVGAAMSWWNPELAASEAHARFQLVCRKPVIGVGERAHGSEAS